MKILWTPQAVRDREQIFTYIEAENPRAAIHTDTLFGDAVGRLVDFPELGKPGLIAGTRELIPHKHYRIVYATAPDAVWVLAIVHTARCWPPVEQTE